MKALYSLILLALFSGHIIYGQEETAINFDAGTFPLASPFAHRATPLWSNNVSGLTMEFEYWGLFGNNGTASPTSWKDTCYIGGQSARCEHPMGVDANGNPTTGKMRILGVKKPVSIEFLLAFTVPGTTTSSGADRRMSLELHMRPSTPGSVWRAVPDAFWTNDRNHAGSGTIVDSSRLFYRQVVDLSDQVDPRVPSYDFEFRTTKLTTEYHPMLTVDNLRIRHGVQDPVPRLLDLDTLTRCLQRHAPAAPLQFHADAMAVRTAIISQFDEHAKAYAETFDPAQITPMTDWMQKRYLKVLREVGETEPQSDEVVVWKMYSSGYIIKTPKNTFAFDLQGGPNNDGRIAGWARGPVAFPSNMSPDMVDAFKAELDHSFHTHFHHDHINFGVVGRFMAGPDAVNIFGPNNNALDIGDDLLDFYCNYPQPLPTCADVSTIVDLTLGNGQVGDGLKVTAFAGRQSMLAVTSPPSPWHASMNTQYHLTTDPINHAYHLETDNGIGILFCGDQRDVHNSSEAVSATDPILTWFQALKADPLKHVHLKLGAGPLINGKVWRDSVVDNFKPLIRIHGHEWEFNHQHIALLSNATCWGNAWPATKEQAMPMIIGEKFIFKKFTQRPVAELVTRNSAVIEFETMLPVSAQVEVCDPATGTVVGVFPSAAPATPAYAHAIQVTGLTPESRYEFRVTSAEGITHSDSAAFVFKTL